MNPFALFKEWISHPAVLALKEPTAMTLATADKNGEPSVRVVLLKNWDERGFVFYTNSLSHKGNDLTENPQAALLFYWMDLERQIRVEGKIEQVTAAEADAYFASRRRESQLGAWASQQSQTLQSREVLLKRLEEYRTKFEGQDVPRPPHWLGYRVIPKTIEFWQEGDFRLHQRQLFARQGNDWEVTLLNP